jgi:ABC-type transporter Mla subunit MlaD
MTELERIDSAHDDLAAQADQTVAVIRSLAGKLQAAGAAGNPAAAEWKQDLREVAVALQAEQQQVGALLQALHDFVLANANQPVSQAAFQAPPPVQQPQYQPQYEQPAPRQGLLARFLGGRFGSAVAQGAGMGLGFGLAEDVIDDIF